MFLYRIPQSFTVLGATGKNATIDFESDRLTLTEALGKVGGLNDQRADAAGVFIFRYENRHDFNAIGHLAIPGRDQGLVPVVYSLNLHDPNSLLLGQRFTMRDKDVMYVSNSPSTDVLKFFQLIGAGVGIAGAGAGISQVAK